ncbi:hypothetical protein BGZ61DRAFT_567002 [Ilyonectria robusta]|uniref:uncharacterized protein n=1 Tax=Ilyonectria robusta TaxID=1079257 RepID=UPI001E8D2EF7|nr:uncharacterized protein BGZ61DRAFT_567002 [Ilyonectria robusta]KAH8659478.1 hypothetical protein BGZ61DRAFT_567002 [Ilyonectria robusta]
MAPTRQSNAERGRLRQACREVLSEHIYISVKPSEIRLSPRATDPYTWKFLPEKEESLCIIFAKKLSDHSISAYRLLCEEVGVTFEAVLKAPSGSTPDICTLSTEMSFSSRILELKQENARLHQELCEWRDKANAESECRREVEKERYQLQQSFQQLQGRVKDYEGDIEYLRSSVSMCHQGLEQVLPMLADLKTGVSFCTA